MYIGRRKQRGKVAMNQIEPQDKAVDPIPTEIDSIVMPNNAENEKNSFFMEDIDDSED